MPCKLGLHNPDEKGGKYIGEDKTRVFYKVLLKLHEDGYKFGDSSAPTITIIPSREFQKNVKGACMNPEDFIGEQLFDDLYCIGVDETESCIDCQYLEGDARNLMKQYTNAADIPLTELALSIRTGALLEGNEQIRTLGDLANQTEAALIATYRMPRTSLCEIKRLLDEYDLGLRAEQ